MLIEVPHTPEALVALLANRDLEIDIRDATDGEVKRFARFLTEHSFSVMYDERPIEEVLFDWKERYGIILADDMHHIGANTPSSYFAVCRFEIGDISGILPAGVACTISDEDFESVF